MAMFNNAALAPRKLLTDSVRIVDAELLDETLDGFQLINSECPRCKCKGNSGSCCSVVKPMHFHSSPHQPSGPVHLPYLFGCPCGAVWSLCSGCLKKGHRSLCPVAGKKPLMLFAGNPIAPTKESREAFNTLCSKSNLRGTGVTHKFTIQDRTSFREKGTRPTEQDWPQTVNHFNPSILDCVEAHQQTAADAAAHNRG